MVPPTVRVLVRGVLLHGAGDEAGSHSSSTIFHRSFGRLLFSRQLPPRLRLKISSCFDFFVEADQK
jgi:hypothetical protein